jgi:antitoxin component YwqK of YwqJK toxin-antitoxin module
MLLRSTYRDGKIHGKFEAWFDNGKPEFTGAYRYNMREGLWYVYNRDGSLRYKVEYANGVPDSDRMEKDAASRIDSLEKFSKRIPDPEKSGAVW